MSLAKTMVYIVIPWMVICDVQSAACCCTDGYNIKKNHIKEKKSVFHACRAATVDVVKDIAWLHRKLCTLETVKVLTAFAPLYVSARLIDKKVHSQFYNDSCHTNKNQLPSTFSKVINKGGDVGIIALSSLAFFAQDEQLRLTARIFGIGAIFTLCAKDIIKECKLDANKRPWNEHFSKKVTYGGFPSGHMAEAAYMAVVWGLQYGLKAAIPLTAFALTSFGVLVNCNRHYVSQVVGGAALGAIYGLAANAVINKKIADTITFEMIKDPQGLPNLTLGYRF